MAIDPVAIYAAVVATGSLGWQVYQRRLDRAGRLDVALKSTWRGNDVYVVEGTIYNSNDYPVKIDSLGLLVYLRRISRYVPLTGIGEHVSLEDAGLPSEVPAHDSVTFLIDNRGWATEGLIRPGGFVKVKVVTSLHHRFSAGLAIRDKRPDWMRARKQPTQISGGDEDLPANANPSIETTDT